MSATPPRPFAFRRSRLGDFHALMRYRIMDILLVASPYDAFLLEEGGQLSERVFGEFRNLDLHYAPGITTVATGAEALALAREQGRFNLVISALRLADMSGAELARRLAADRPGVPVVLLAFDNRELQDFVARSDLSAVERVFLWQGDARILLAIVKCVEDRRNVEHDTRSVGVQVILLIEDNVRYYSSFLPTIYGELLQHSQRLIVEGANLAEKITRMRARPKILLCETFEQASLAFSAHEADILGVVSDIEFPREGRWSASAGLDFVREVRQRWPDVPVLLQSSRPDNAELAREVGADFLLKGSELLLADLRRFMLANFGFGDFAFRMPDGREIGRASDLRGLEALLREAPAESIAYHAERNHFSKWLKARTEFDLAHELRPRRVEDFPTVEDLRASLIRSITEYRRERGRAVVADFEPESLETADFHRIGGGSLGGKARGLAFLRRLLAEARADHDLQGVELGVPRSVVLGTDVFDRFLEENDLRDFALRSDDDRALRERFLAARFPEPVRHDLSALLERLQVPLAVRSSSLLEDSQYLPFTGVYETFMLPNNDPSLELRLAQLLRAIACVFASTFSQAAKSYMRATPYRLEEEKMAVIVQELVGVRHGERFYPDFAGVARSFNFYPHPPLAAGDGIAAVALGLGRTVVEEAAGLQFCPRFPRHLLQLSSARDILRHSQRRFWAVDLRPRDPDADPETQLRESLFDLADAEADGTLGALASTYDSQDDAVRDGIAKSGTRVVTFAPILKHDAFPLAEILTRLLDLGAWGMGHPVELEFAVRLTLPPGTPRQFGVLQLRPLALSSEGDELELGEVEPERVLCRSDRVLGNGRVELRDVIVVDRHRFDRALSRQTAGELARLNAELLAEGAPYLLVGVGRWGSTDPWLGIPVAWEQISGARVVVEAGFKDFRVTPSQGSHFFQNLTSFNVGYFTVNPDAHEGILDWDWLSAQPALRETASARHLRFERPLRVTMNGRRNQGLILKP